MFPFSTDVKLEGQTSMNIVLEKVELGKPIDDSIFIKPEPKKEEKKK
jgi:hypothetical protein